MFKNLALFLVLAALITSCASDPERIAKGQVTVLNAEQKIDEREQKQAQEQEIFLMKKQTAMVKEQEKQEFMPEVYDFYGSVLVLAKIAIGLAMFVSVGFYAFFLVTKGMERFYTAKQHGYNVAYLGRGKFSVLVGGNSKMLDTRQFADRSVLHFLTDNEQPIPVEFPERQNQPGGVEIIERT